MNQQFVPLVVFLAWFAVSCGPAEEKAKPVPVASPVTATRGTCSALGVCSLGHPGSGTRNGPHPTCSSSDSSRSSLRAPGGP